MLTGIIECMNDFMVCLNVFGAFLMNLCIHTRNHVNENKLFVTGLWLAIVALGIGVLGQEEDNKKGEVVYNVCLHGSEAKYGLASTVVMLFSQMLFVLDCDINGLKSFAASWAKMLAIITLVVSWVSYLVSVVCFLTPSIWMMEKRKVHGQDCPPWVTRLFIAGDVSEASVACFYIGYKACYKNARGINNPAAQVELEENESEARNRN